MGSRRKHSVTLASVAMALVATTVLFAVPGCRSRPQTTASSSVQSGPQGTRQSVDIARATDPGTCILAENKRSIKVPRSQNLSLSGQPATDGKARFCWPAAGEVIDRDYARLGQLMTEYATLVGTCLNRDPDGPGEEEFLENRQFSGMEIVDGLRLGGLKGMCEAVVDELVKTTYEGSKFCQYGNCGEGALIGVCLALRSGFQTNEIRYCRAGKVHVFGMVYKNPREKWCVMDRWDVVQRGFFHCGADWDPSQKTLTLDGVSSTAEWYRDVTCQDLTHLKL
jgi:hypothetical protein